MGQISIDRERREGKLVVPAYPAFRFLVEIKGVGRAAFTECTLPDIEVEIEEVKEGGLNSYVHQLPGRRRAAKISLKNGIGQNDLLDWYLETLSGLFSRRTASIELRDSMQNMVMRWNIEEVLPYKWSGPQLRAEDNTIAIQTLEMTCGEITVSFKKK